MGCNCNCHTCDDMCNNHATVARAAADPRLAISDGMVWPKIMPLSLLFGAEVERARAAPPTMAPAAAPPIVMSAMTDPGIIL